MGKGDYIIILYIRVCMRSYKEANRHKLRTGKQDGKCRFRVSDFRRNEAGKGSNEPYSFKLSR